jgi:DNA polymerase III alpha subunit
MIRDNFGQQIYSERDLCDLYLQDRSRKMTEVLVDSDIKFDQLDLTTIPELIRYAPSSETPEEFDARNQASWFLPAKYATMDIASWVMDQCKTTEELERVGQELIMFSERDMIPLLRYLKYLVDTMREHHILWGVGRGSSTSSYVLFLIGIHRINSIQWNLSIDEFLR